MQYQTDLLVSSEFLLTGILLRHLERHRISEQNRLYALTEFPRHKDWGMHLPAEHPDVVWLAGQLAQAEAREDEKIEDLVARYMTSPLQEWSAQYKGLAPGKLLARFLAETGDPYLQTAGFTPEGEEITEPRVRTFSQLKSYCGFAVRNGKLAGRVVGEQSAYSSRARTRLWLITDQLVKQHDTTFYPIFTAGVEKYQDEKYRGVTQSGKPWSDAQFAVIGRKRARVLVSVEFLRGLYEKARELHDPAAHAAAQLDKKIADIEETASE